MLSRSLGARYGVSLVVWALALGLTVWLAPYLERILFMLFWPAVIFCAWYGGRGPAALVTVLGAAGVALLVIPPAGNVIGEKPSDLLAPLYFVVLATGVTELTARLHRERERSALAERAAAERAVQLERVAREAEAANRAKGDFLAVMSHELRTPLNAIAGHTQLIELEIYGPITDAQREALSRIQGAQRHLLGLINDVLNYAKVEAGRVEYRLADVSLREAMLPLEPLIELQLQEKALRYEQDECDAQLRLRADPEKLRQILLNLLSNAIKFTPAGGEISVSCVERDEVVEIAVRDTGIGIPADKLEQVFAPFVQVHRKLTTGHEGTGLGLAISRDLARGMGGDLRVESRPGEGSTFTLALPRAEGEAVERHSDPPVKTPARTG